MNNKEKRGSIEISFGMIFSIILIIAVVAIAVYAITIFINLGEGTDLALFRQEFQSEIDDIWASAITDRVVSFGLPRGIESVCFGSLAGSNFNANYQREFEELQRYASNFEKTNTNRFIYPTQKSGEFAYKKVEHIDLSALGGFDCFEVRNRKVEIRMVKGNFGSAVKLQHPQP